MSAASLANIATLGWYRRHTERARIERWKAEWRRVQGAPGRATVLESGARPNPFGGITVAQFGANISALSCPAGHDNAVPVEDLLGEVVAWLCPDCDKQLPVTVPIPEDVAAAWRTPPEPPRDYVAEHKKNHHGHPAAFLLACRECAYEQNPSYREWGKQ